MESSFLSAAAQDDTLARFNGGIGVIPVSSGVAPDPAQLTSEVVNRNFVRGVQPAGQIWVIDKLEATVRANGQISVHGKGLILGGGNKRREGDWTIRICHADLFSGSPLHQFSTTLTGVQLANNGDFKIDDMLSPAPPFSAPAPCF